MNTDDLEQKLRRQPRREVPREWRAEILAAAGAPVSEPARTDASRNTRRSGDRRSAPPWWLAWLHPSRAGWGALGAAWLVIVAFHFAGSGGGASAPGAGAGAASPEQWLEHRRVMAELLGPTEPAEPPAVTRPRGDRRTNALLLCA